MISKTLKTVVMFCRPNLVFEAKDVSTSSLRSKGAIALLCASVDSNTINLIGRWYSNEMLQYLHVQVDPLMGNFSKLVLTHGNYSFLPQRRGTLFLIYFS